MSAKWTKPALLVGLVTLVVLPASARPEHAGSQCQPTAQEAGQQSGKEKPDQTPHDHSMPEDRKHSGEQEQTVHEGMTMGGMNMAKMNPAGMLLMDEASGTSVNPASSPMHMASAQSGTWTFMFHGILYLSEIQQSGPRGAGKFISTNWFMGMAEHDMGHGSFLFRAMLSLDPVTVTQRRYPELFQTGETAFGKPLVDGQHPHDLFMELAFQYAHPVGEKTILSLYFAPIGDPALGPVAFPHRVSAAEIPQAPLSHHLQDSTHIADEVITAGVKHRSFRIEIGGFHGAEPNENRWNIDAGAIDSWAARFSVTPTKNWVAQVSAGRLKRPEAAEPGDIVRSTGSVTYNRPLTNGNWATSLIWGRNHKTPAPRNLNSYLLESVLQFRKKNYLSGRIELVDKDELFDDQPDIRARLASTVGSVFRIAAYTMGYTRDVSLIPRVETSFGANLTLYTIPSVPKPFYADHPVAGYFFLRMRLKQSDSMYGMQMP